MIYYPLTTLMLAGVKQFLIISGPEQLPGYRKLLGLGDDWGINIQYKVQPKPAGLPQAFIIGEEFMAGEGCVMMLGDNIVHGHSLPFQEAINRSLHQYTTRATAFVTRVVRSHLYGVIRFADKACTVPSELVEKPGGSEREWVAIGTYIVDGNAPRIARELKPSERGELEIVDLLRHYMDRQSLEVVKLGRGYAWFDAGDFESLLEASQYVRAIQQRQGSQIASPEEAAFRNGWIDATALRHLASRFPNTYGSYLEQLSEENP